MLTHTDRCDRCGAQAFVAAFFTVGELMFCAHHAREYDIPLRLQAEELYDGTAMINTKASVAAY